MTTHQPFTPPHPLNTAVLFLVFNRLDTTKQVFEAIRQAKPPRLYVAADGARANKEGEAEKVQAVRDYIMQNIDWECEVKTLFRETNLGCGPAVKEAIDWFFDHEESGIILEDDTIPIQSFFWFCETLLEKYRCDNRIAMINGTNRLGASYFSASYLYSKNKDCWGWASWRRAWKNMDLAMSWRATKQYDDVISNMGMGLVDKCHWRRALNSIDNSKVSAWDWQWYFSIACQNQMTIFPNCNLIENVGYGSEATHTKSPGKLKFSTKNIELPLSAPTYMVPNSGWDRDFLIRRKSLREKLKLIITRILGYC